jgi:hypothetical protein
MQDVELSTIASWKEFAESKLPPADFVNERNKKITALYAVLYNEYPDLFKWAGMAAFASHKVGLALKPFEFYLDKNGCLQPDCDFDNSPLDLMDDLNIIRYTNNKVFEDIAWIHFAYTSPCGGIYFLNELLKDNAENRLLLEGFAFIDKGKLFAATNKALSEKYIWYGNSLLLKHEQLFTVQPMFSKLEFGFRKFLALATAMDFDARNMVTDRKTYTSFYLYMWIWGIHLLLKTRSFPSICNFEHRWQWIDKRMLGIWKQVDRSDSTLRKKISLLMDLQAQTTRPKTEDLSAPIQVHWHPE